MAVNIKLFEHDRGWDRIATELKKARKSYTKVGIQQAEGAEDKEVWDGNVKRATDDVDLFTVAVVNEYGTKDGHIPERSFLRSTADEERNKTSDMLSRGIDSIYRGRCSVREILQATGAYLTAKVQRKIVAIKIPPNALATQLSKGRRLGGKGKLVDNPLIDTGQLRQSIRHEEVIK